MYKNKFFSAQQNKTLHQTQGPPQKSNTIITVHVLSAIVIFSGNTCLKVVVFSEQNFLSAGHAQHAIIGGMSGVPVTPLTIIFFVFFFFFPRTDFFFSVLNISSYSLGLRASF